MTAHHPFRFGIVANFASTAEEWIAKARRAEELGYTTLLLPDHLGPGLAPMPALAAAAIATERLRVGTYVLANDLRNPVMVAREAITLDRLSNGRFELGLGAGRPSASGDYRKLGIPFDPGSIRVERLTEALGIIEGVLSGERVDAPGPHYAASGAELRPGPIQQPRPPILIAASGKRVLALAARQADIVALGAGPAEGQSGIKERVDWLKQAAGNRFAQLEININLLAVVTEQVTGADPRQPGARFGLNIEDLIRAGSPFVLSGTPEQMCDQLIARREALDVSYISVSDDLMETLAPVVERLSSH